MKFIGSTQVVSGMGIGIAQNITISYHALQITKADVLIYNSIRVLECFSSGGYPSMSFL